MIRKDILIFGATLWGVIIFIFLFLSQILNLAVRPDFVFTRTILILGIIITFSLLLFIISFSIERFIFKVKRTIIAEEERVKVDLKEMIEKKDGKIGSLKKTIVELKAFLQNSGEENKDLKKEIRCLKGVDVQAYLETRDLERSLKRFVVGRLKEVYPETWNKPKEEGIIDKDSYEKAEDYKKVEKMRDSYLYVDENLNIFDYFSLEEIKKLIEDNFQLFSKKENLKLSNKEEKELNRQKKLVTSDIEKLVGFRDKVAHPRPFDKGDVKEIRRIKESLKKRGMIK